MNKSIKKTLIGLGAVIILIGGIKGSQILTMINQKRPVMTETVTGFKAEPQTWETTLKAVGSLYAVQGIMVSAEQAGKVTQIAFEPGTMVQAGDLLVQQDIAAESAQLRSAEATLALTRINFERASKLYREKTSSRSEYDNADAQLKQAAAQVDNIKAVISKKTIRAPFAGMLGIRIVNLGQMLSAGDAIVSLQSLDPVFVNFALPQQHLAKLAQGLTVRVETDALPGTVLQGTITAINPQVDAATRNIMVQATVKNPEYVLRPGMFVTATVVLPEQQTVLAIPATGVLHAPYSDSVFVVEDVPDNASFPAGKKVRQQFVRLGNRQGDFMEVLAGLKQGEMVVSTGVFKLRNGQAVGVDNALAPQFSLNPTPQDR
jgi:membrane fusion protein (multidrug efflux system)